mmetsp:Transcript_33732/g.88725  ORF Transcript_33732/g.88725 Transcript_33732/m.88725 type:complete len:211 (+) Transcript_33732:147-779(+)
MVNAFPLGTDHSRHRGVYLLPLLCPCPCATSRAPLPHVGALRKMPLFPHRATRPSVVKKPISAKTDPALGIRTSAICHPGLASPYSSCAVCALPEAGDRRVPSLCHPSGGSSSAGSGSTVRHRVYTPPGERDRLGELCERGGEQDDSVLLHWPTPSRPQPWYVGRTRTPAVSLQTRPVQADHIPALVDQGCSEPVSFIHLCWFSSCHVVN